MSSALDGLALSDAAIDQRLLLGDAPFKVGHASSADRPINAVADEKAEGGRCWRTGAIAQKWRCEALPSVSIAPPAVVVGSLVFGSRVPNAASGRFFEEGGLTQRLIGALMLCWPAGRLDVHRIPKAPCLVCPGWAAERKIAAFGRSFGEAVRPVTPPCRRRAWRLACLVRHRAWRLVCLTRPTGRLVCDGRFGWCGREATHERERSNQGEPGQSHAEHPARWSA